MGWSTIPKVIKSVKLAKNLTKRREDFEDIVKAVQIFPAICFLNDIIFFLRRF